MIDDYQIVELERRVAWQPLDDYPEDGEAQIAETSALGRRLIVRRTRLIGPQAELWPDWRYFPIITNRSDPFELVEREHRQHAVAERSLDASVIRRKECPARLVPGGTVDEKRVTRTNRRMSSIGAVVGSSSTIGVTVSHSVEHGVRVTTITPTG